MNCIKKFSVGSFHHEIFNQLYNKINLFPNFNMISINKYSIKRPSKSIFHHDLFNSNFLRPNLERTFNKASGSFYVLGHNKNNIIKDTCEPWLPNLDITRNLTYYDVNMPKPETTKKNLRFKVHYPEDGKYTIKKLNMTKLAGRDPETGRIIFGKIGGGHKRKYRWIMFNRLPDDFQDPLIEKVIQVQYDPNRSARIALVGHNDFLRFIIATDGLKGGDIITSTRVLPRIPIRPKIGDAHPVGALPFGTEICCVEKRPRTGRCFKLAGGTSAVILRKVDGKIIVQVNSLYDFALDPNCLACVGKVSNANHPKLIIGSAQRNRWLGVRPSSGLWQRKGGRFGFKRKKKGPSVHFGETKPEKKILNLTISGEGPSRKITPCTDRVT